MEETDEASRTVPVPDNERMEDGDAAQDRDLVRTTQRKLLSGIPIQR